MNSIEVSVNGRWHSVPSLQVGRWHVITKGSWIKMASLHGEAWLERDIDDPQRFIRALKESPQLLRADVFTFARRPWSTAGLSEYHAERDNVAAIALTTFDEWWECLPQETRKNARRAAKRGVVTSVQPFNDVMVRGLVELNNDSPIVQGMRSRHYGKSFEEVQRDYSTFNDRSDFICAHAGDELIGVLKLVYSDQAGLILQLMTKKRHDDKRPANALLVKAVQLCFERRLTYLAYGKYRYGNQKHTSLMEFKRRHGFSEMPAVRYYVPLTWRGRAAISLGLHRSLIQTLPPSVIVAVQNARRRLRQLAP